MQARPAARNNSILYPLFVVLSWDIQQGKSGLDGVSDTSRLHLLRLMCFVWQCFVCMCFVSPREATSASSPALVACFVSCASSRSCTRGMYFVSTGPALVASRILGQTHAKRVRVSYIPAVQCWRRWDFASPTCLRHICSGHRQVMVCNRALHSKSLHLRMTFETTGPSKHISNK